MIWFGIASTMEYRWSFFSKVIGMVLNDVGLLLLWIIFFAKFPEVNGWQFSDMILLYAVLMTSFSLSVLIFGGATTMSKTIAQGELDYYLALPKNVLWHVSVGKIYVEALGDLIFGISMFILSRPDSIGQVLLYILIVGLVSFGMYNFGVAVHSLAFFFGNYEETAERWYWTTFGLAFNPQGAFSGPLKLVLMTVMPVFFMSNAPVRLLKQYTGDLLVGLILFAVIAFFLAQILFRWGLRRYESGNLINVRI
jgi:ABC-2 type transport system permease protein